MLLNKIKESKGIKNDLILLIKLEIKRMMNDTNDLKEEIDYLSQHFIEIDPYILNQIDLKVIENAIVKRKNDCQDSLLYKILRLDKSHKQHLICFVDFQLVSNKAMKLFLSSIDFSFINEQILETISIRLSLPIADIYEIEDDEQDRESTVLVIAIISADDLFERLHLKEVLGYNDSLEIMISSERNYIANNFALFFSNLEIFVTQYFFMVQSFFNEIINKLF